MKQVDYNADVRGVRVYYADGSRAELPSYTLPEGFVDAPSTGVQVVAVFWRNGYATWLASCDYYGFDGKAFYATNRADEIPEEAHVKTGSLMDKADFMALYNAVMQERW